MLRMLYSVRQFCSEHRISRSTLYREIAAGRLRVIKCHTMTFITADESSRWHYERGQHLKRTPYRPNFNFSLVNWLNRRSLVNQIKLI